MKKIAVCAAFMAMLFAAGPALAGKIIAFVSIVPQKYFVEQIGGDKVDVEVMVPPGADPHTYEPRPNQMVRLSKAVVYFAVGVTFEKAWLPRFADLNKNLLIVHTDEQVKKRAMEARHHEGEAEGHEQEATTENEGVRRHHEGLDPHIWTSPPLVKIQARAILDGLSRVDPANREYYENNYERFINELTALDTEIKTIVGSGKKGRSFLVFHPAWGYFADAYGLEEIPIEIEGKEPKPAELKDLIEEARKMGVKVIFVQPQLARKSAETIARAIGAQVVFADPLAADWAENLKRVATEFSQALR